MYAAPESIPPVSVLGEPSTISPMPSPLTSPVELTEYRLLSREVENMRNPTNDVMGVARVVSCTSPNGGVPPATLRPYITYTL